MKKVTVLFVAFVSLAVWYSSPAYADSPSSDDDNNLNARLHGEYAFAWTRVCSGGMGTEENPVFTPAPDLRLLTGGGQNTRMTQGVLRYNGNGTGTMEGARALTVLSGQYPIRQNEFICEFTYRVHSNDTFTQWMSCNSTRIAGPVVGDFFQITGLVVQGQIGKTGKTLVLGDTDINVESFTRNRDGEITHFQRICTRSGTAVKVRRGNEDGRDD